MPPSTPPTSRESPIDVLVIGAGPAGLAFGTSIARLLHTCIIFSHNQFRNQKSDHMHGLPTWEHRNPAEFRSAARADILSHYSTTFFEDVGISAIEKHQREDGTSLFKAVDENGKEWWGRKLVLASGVKDIMPDIDGYEECWVSGIFHCLFCHGYEERGAESAGVLAIDDCSPAPLALHLARYANRLASKVTIYTHGNEEVTKAIETALSQLKPESKTKKNVAIEAKKIIKLVKLPKGAEIEVYLEGGEKKVEGFLAHKPQGKQQGPWAEQLGLEMTEQGDIKVNPPFNATNVPGVFAGGDCGVMMKAATVALSHGGLLAAGVAAQLEAED